MTQLEAANVQGNQRNQLAVLKKENDSLKLEVESWKIKLTKIESSLGIKQFASDSAKTGAPVETQAVKETAPATLQVDAVPSGDAPGKQPNKKEGKKKKPEGKLNIWKTFPSSVCDMNGILAGKPAESAANPGEDGTPADIGMIDLRVGRIVNVKKHPDADS